MQADRIIDFHVHCFPERLAEKAMYNLSERAKSEPYTNGTIDDTLRALNQWNIDYAVSLNIAVLPKSVRKVNDFAIETDGGRIISFGSVHPYSEIWESELERIHSNGLKGIKLHPEYQEFDVDDPNAIKIYRKCAKLGLIVVLHAGKDIAYPDTLKAPPEGILNASIKSPDTKFVCAHMGAQKCWEGVLKHLAGRENIWFDTAYSARSLDKDMFRRLADRQGTKKILFATDCPWESGIITKDYIYNMGYTKEELDDIMYNNASKLLGGLNG